MVRRRLVWTHTAAAQRRSILKYWNERNQSNSFSKKLIGLIKVRTKLLIDFPESGKEVDFPDTRVISMGYYSIFYKIGLEEIIVTGFWDNRQDPQKLLELLKKK